MKKEIILTCEPFVNFTSHLLGVAQIGYKSEYSEIYQYTVIPEDIKYLQEKITLLKWGNGLFGSLTWILIFFPNYLNLKNKAEMVEYFQLLNDALEQKSFNNFKTRYREAFAKLQNWLEPGINSELFAYKTEIKRISEIYLNNYERFLSEVWPIEEKKIQAKIVILNQKLAKLDYIALWEKLTKLTFKYDRYEITLSSGIKNGPSANSLGYEKNWFYYDADPDWLIKFLSHETGTHILVDLIKEMMPSGEGNEVPADFQIWYNGYENLCSFYNQVVLKEAGLVHNYGMPEYDSESFMAIYERLFSADSTITAKKLFERGISEYKRGLSAKR